MKILSNKNEMGKTCSMYTENEYVYIEVCRKHGQMRLFGIPVHLDGG